MKVQWQEIEWNESAFTGNGIGMNMQLPEIRPRYIVIPRTTRGW
jgi:hypothetical protein